MAGIIVAHAPPATTGHSDHHHHQQQQLMFLASPRPTADGVIRASSRAPRELAAAHSLASTFFCFVSIAMIVFCTAAVDMRTSIRPATSSSFSCLQAGRRLVPHGSVLALLTLLFYLVDDKVFRLLTGSVSAVLVLHMAWPSLCCTHPLAFILPFFVLEIVSETCKARPAYGGRAPAAAAAAAAAASSSSSGGGGGGGGSASDLHPCLQPILQFIEDLVVTRVDPWMEDLVAKHVDPWMEDLVAKHVDPWMDAIEEDVKPFLDTEVLQFFLDGFVLHHEAFIFYLSRFLKHQTNFTFVFTGAVKHRQAFLFYLKGARQHPAAFKAMFRRRKLIFRCLAFLRRHRKTLLGHSRTRSSQSAREYTDAEIRVPLLILGILFYFAPLATGVLLLFVLFTVLSENSEDHKTLAVTPISAPHESSQFLTTATSFVCSFVTLILF